jgi:hypothetical protein
VVQIPAGARSSLLHNVRPAPGLTQPPSQWLQGALSLGVKRVKSEADHSPPSSAEVKNGGAIPPLPRMSSWHSGYKLSTGKTLLLFGVALYNCEKSSLQLAIIICIISYKFIPVTFFGSILWLKERVYC